MYVSLVCGEDNYFHLMCPTVSSKAPISLFPSSLPKNLGKQKSWRVFSTRIPIPISPFLKFLFKNQHTVCHTEVLLFFVATELGMQDLNSQSGIKLGAPCIGRWSLNHWTTREVPRSTFLDWTRSGNSDLKSIKSIHKNGQAQFLPKYGHYQSVNFTRARKFICFAHCCELRT